MRKVLNILFILVTGSISSGAYATGFTNIGQRARQNMPSATQTAPRQPASQQTTIQRPQLPPPAPVSLPPGCREDICKSAGMSVSLEGCRRFICGGNFFGESTIDIKCDGRTMETGEGEDRVTHAICSIRRPSREYSNDPWQDIGFPIPPEFPMGQSRHSLKDHFIPEWILPNAMAIGPGFRSPGNMGGLDQIQLLPQEWTADEKNSAGQALRGVADNIRDAIVNARTEEIGRPGDDLHYYSKLAYAVALWGGQYLEAEREDENFCPSGLPECCFTGGHLRFYWSPMANFVEEWRWVNRLWGARGGISNARLVIKLFFGEISIIQEIISKVWKKALYNVLRTDPEIHVPLNFRDADSTATGMAVAFLASGFSKYMIDESKDLFASVQTDRDYLDMGQYAEDTTAFIVASIIYHFLPERVRQASDAAFNAQSFKDIYDQVKTNSREARLAMAYRVETEMQARMESSRPVGYLAELMTVEDFENRFKNKGGIAVFLGEIREKCTEEGSGELSPVLVGASMPPLHRDHLGSPLAAGPGTPPGGTVGPPPGHSWNPPSPLGGQPNRPGYQAPGGDSVFPESCMTFLRGEAGRDVDCVDTCWEYCRGNNTYGWSSPERCGICWDRMREDMDGNCASGNESCRAFCRDHPNQRNCQSHLAERCAGQQHLSEECQNFCAGWYLRYPEICAAACERQGIDVIHYDFCADICEGNNERSGDYFCTDLCSQEPGSSFCHRECQTRSSDSNCREVREHDEEVARDQERAAHPDKSCYSGSGTSFMCGTCGWDPNQDRYEPGPLSCGSASSVDCARIACPGCLDSGFRTSSTCLYCSGGSCGTTGGNTGGGPGSTGGAAVGGGSSGSGSGSSSGSGSGTGSGSSGSGSGTGSGSGSGSSGGSGSGSGSGSGTGSGSGDGGDSGGSGTPSGTTSDGAELCCYFENFGGYCARCVNGVQTSDAMTCPGCDIPLEEVGGDGGSRYGGGICGGAISTTYFADYDGNLCIDTCGPIWCANTANCDNWAGMLGLIATGECAWSTDENGLPVTYGNCINPDCVPGN